MGKTNRMADAVLQKKTPAIAPALIARQKASPIAPCCRLAVQLLNGLTETKEVNMDKEGSHMKWKISQVERLIGLPRRDIQRACYRGQGGAAILSPKDSSWGRRTYDSDDLARLFVVKRLKDQGLSLPEIKKAFTEAERSGNTIQDMLAIHVHRLKEHKEEIDRQLAVAETLLDSLSDPRENHLCRQSLKQQAAQAMIRILIPLANDLTGCGDADGGIRTRIVTRFPIYENDFRPLINASMQKLVEESAPRRLFLVLNDVERHSVSRCIRGLMEQSASPDSSETQRALRDIAKRIVSNPDMATKVLIWAIVDAFLDDPSAECIVEFWCGPGSFDFVQKAIWAYGDALEQSSKDSANK